MRYLYNLCALCNKVGNATYKYKLIANIRGFTFTLHGNWPQIMKSSKFLPQSQKPMFSANGILWGLLCFSLNTITGKSQELEASNGTDTINKAIEALNVGTNY